MYNVLQTTDLDLFMLIQWENLQVVDIAFPIHRVGVIVDTDSVPNVDISNINSDIQAMQWAMEENGWNLVTLNYVEFKQGGAEYIDEIKDQLTQVKKFPKFSKFFS